MLKEEYSKERIQYLASQIASLSLGKFQRGQLGNIALEILIMRSRVESVLEQKGSQAEQRRARKALEQVKQLEKSVVQLYLLARLQREGSEDLFLDYLTRRHSFMERE